MCPTLRNIQYVYNDLARVIDAWPVSQSSGGVFDAGNWKGCTIHACIMRIFPASVLIFVNEKLEVN